VKPRPAADFAGKPREAVIETFEARHPRTRLKIDKTVAPENLAKVAAAADDILEDYPEIARRVKRFYIASEARMVADSGSGAAAANFWGFAKIWLRRVYISAKMVAEGDRSVTQRFGVSSGFHPRGTDTVRAVIVHEFAHHLDYGLRESTRKGLMSKWSDFRRDNAEALASVSGYARKAYAKNSDPEEGIAEAFSQLDAKWTGYYKGELSVGAVALEKFLTENKIGKRRKA
jgi:hypothetical protein